MNREEHAGARSANKSGSAFKIVVGVVLLGILGLGGCGYLAFNFFKGMEAANSELSTATDDLFKAIENDTFGEWYDVSTTGDLKKVSGRAQWIKLGKGIKQKLGKLQSKSMTGLNINSSNFVTHANLNYSAQFEKGKGTIVLVWRKSGDIWKLVSFKVNSPVFLEISETVECAKCEKEHGVDADFCPHCGAAVVDSKTPLELDMQKEKKEEVGD